ncbi:hypothetical protein BGW42_003218 [Actinomortierella wolfii]|nr:hypothetical protein BGW42_003218 [Actinomortierella wolfii]
MQERYCRPPQQHIKHIWQPRQFLSPNVSNHALELRPYGFRQKHVSSMSNIKETRRPWLPENDIALLELRRQGWSWKAIGQFFERSPQATQRRYNSLLWLDAHGSRHKGPTSPEALETQMKVLKIWINQQGMSWEQAAALLETKVPVLQHRLQIWEESEEKQKALLQTLKEGHRVGMAKVADIQADRQPTRVRFSRAGEDKLLQAIEKYGAENWEKIARQVFDNRYTPYQLRRKYIQIKQWTKAREDHLMACVSQVAKYPDGVFNDSVWQTTAEKMKAKEGVQYTPAECHDKWIDVLRRRGIDPAKWSPPWSASEMNSFWSLWKTYGQDWEAIASRLERRTVQDCQLQFSYLLKDGSERGPKDPEELEVLRLYFSASTPKRIRWSTDMQDQLVEAVQAWREIHPGERINWKWVAKRLNLPGVTDLKCFQRWSNSHQKRAHMRPDSSEHPRKETEVEDNPRFIKSVADVNEIDENHQLTQGKGAKKKWTEAESQQLTALLSKSSASATNSNDNEPQAKKSSTRKTSSKGNADDKKQLRLNFGRHGMTLKGPSPELTVNATNFATEDITVNHTFEHHLSSPGVATDSVNNIYLQASRQETITENSVKVTTTIATVEKSSINFKDNTIASPSSDLFQQGQDNPSSDNRTESLPQSPLDENDDAEWDLLPDDSDLKSIPLGDISTEQTEVLFPKKYRWKTSYAAAFELALDTVLAGESFLFSDEELSVFDAYRGLPDDSKYLMARLYLRKQAFWFRLSKLEGRYQEIDNLQLAIDELEKAGLTLNEKDMDDPLEAMNILSLAEVKTLAVSVGLKDRLSGMQRSQLIETIMNHFRQQSFISKRLLVRNTSIPDDQHNINGDAFIPRPRELVAYGFDDDTKRCKALITKIIKISGPCLKINPQVLKIFLRLHLVYLRSREYTEKPALVQAILARIGQRNFPPYETKRSTAVFRSREELLKYEEALRVQYNLEEMIAAASGPGSGTTVFIKDADHDRVDPYILAAKAKAKANSMTRVKDRKHEVDEILSAVVEEAEKFREPWRQYCASEPSVEQGATNYYMLRFSPGWIYTRILRIELKALATLKRFQEEAFLLHELLDQKVYCLGTRGEWYDRLALIKSNYAYDKRLGKQEALQVCMQALRDKYVHATDATAIQARIVRLESELRVPFRERHDFSYLELREAKKRTLVGERLNRPGTAAPGYASSHSYAYVIPTLDGSTATMTRAMSTPEVRQCPLWRSNDGSAVSVEELALSFYRTLGYKGFHSENAILSTLFGLMFWDILFTPIEGVFETAYQTAPLDLGTEAFYMTRQSMIEERVQAIAQSILLSDEQIDEKLQDMPENEEESNDNSPAEEVVTVVTPSSVDKQEGNGKGKIADIECMKEERQRARRLAVKRQACFYLDLLSKVDDQFRARNVLCVGVSWAFEKEELLQIAECIGGNALAEICRHLAQEYGQRCSGMPDLCCWDYGKKRVKFVEVKGPGDRLSTKQKVWIDLLSSVCVDVELCLVEASTAEEDFEEERRLMN